MNEQNYTSLKLSKWLKENGCTVHPFDFYDSHYSYAKVKHTTDGLHNAYDIPCYDILYNICLKHPKEFFGTEIDNSCRNANCHYDGCSCSPIIPFKTHPMKIFKYILEGKKQEAEEYIKEHCLFNPNNK